MRLALATLLTFVLVAAVAVGYPPLTITDKTQDTITLGGLKCGKKYRIKVSERNGGEWTDSRTKKRATNPCPTEPPPPACNLNATPANFAAQVSAASSGQTVCLAAGDYGTWSGTNKAITVRGIPGSVMRFSFGSGDAGFTVDGVQGAGGSLSGGVADVTVRNSAFSSCVNFSGAQSNVVFTQNTHTNINATCGNSRIGLGASGVTIRDSLMQGGDSDGVFVGSDGNAVISNRFVDLCEGPTGNHTDGLQFADPNAIGVADPGQTLGYNTVVRGNYFSFRGCANGYGQALTSFDSGSDGALLEDNVVDTTRPWGIELYSDDGSTVRHNTVRYYPDSNCEFGGLSCGQIELTAKSGDPAGVGTQVYDNVGQVSIGAATVARNDHNVQGPGVVFVGPLDSWAGYLLAPGSLGVGAASDGLNAGIRP